MFGFDKFVEATTASYTGRDLPKPKTKEQLDAEAEKDEVPDNSALRKPDASRIAKTLAGCEWETWFSFLLLLL